ncbi:hypothetical protein GF402_02045 [Candidatus Fermentibacteria bacterium]|nr:hypothetical protein [Candidatus Fermentibacteria bacterium]
MEIPGTLISPPGDTVSVRRDSMLLLYHWLPLAGHPDMENDLRQLDRIRNDSVVRVIPVQFDEAVRNEAQRVVNDLGLSLPVYLGDAILQKHLSSGVLPLSALVTMEEELRSAGYGSPRRILREVGMVPP